MSKKTASRIVSLIAIVALMLLCCACGQQNIDPTGVYSFEEVYSGSSGRSDFSTRNWNVEFKEDGTYLYTYDEVSGGGGPSGPSETTTTTFFFEGTYTVMGETIQCATPTRGYSLVTSVVDADGNPVEEDPENPRVEKELDLFVTLTSNFFNDDQSCDWVIDKDAGTAVPVKYREPISNRDNNDAEE